MPEEEKEAQTLDDLFKSVGPLTKTELVGHNVDPNTVRWPRILIVHKRTRRAWHPATDLLPGASGQNIFFPMSQLPELGLKIGRQVPLNKPYQFYRALTVLVGNALPDLPIIQAIIHMHYLPNDSNDPSRIHGNHSTFYRLLQNQGYVVIRGNGITSAWTNSGWHMLARVRENQRQASTIKHIDANRRVLERKDITYEDAAKALGWTTACAENYRALAREAGQPPNIFVIGTGWQKRLTFNLEQIASKSNATAKVAYGLLRAGSECTVDSTLDLFCRIAALNNRDHLNYEINCSKFVKSDEDKFLESQGYVNIIISKRRRGLQKVKIEMTRSGAALYRMLSAEGRLDVDGHHAYI